MFIIKPRVQGVTEELLDVYSKVCISTIGHMTDFGFIKEMQPLVRPTKFVGNAITVKIPHGDSSALQFAIDMAQPGDVVVVDMSGDDHRSCWGGGISYAAKLKKIAGAVINGSINDVDEIMDYEFPIFSLGVSPLTTKILGLEGEVNTTISVRGVTVNPGDLIAADSDGVFVIDPKNPMAMEYGKIAIEKQVAEKEFFKKLESGMSLASLSGADKFIEK